MAPTASASQSKTRSMALIALFAVLIAICSWISIPTLIPFTLQTFAVCLAVGVLGGRRGTLAVLVYLLLGMVGIPVFSGFRGGLGHLLGATGGYIIGFLLTALLMWGMEALLGRKTWVLAVSMALGLMACYAFGTVWYVIVYARTAETIGFVAALGVCVFPYVIPDLVKLALALLLSRRLRTILKLA